MSLADDLAAEYTAPEVDQPRARIEFDGGTGVFDTGTIRGNIPEDFTPLFRQCLEAAGHDPDQIRLGRPLKESHWQQKSRDSDEPIWLHAYKFEASRLGTCAVIDLEEIVKKAKKKEPAKGTGGHWFVFQGGDQQIGKALSDDTPVLTTEGWKNHGDIRPNDYVYGPDGQPKRVYSVTGSTEQELFRVGFDRGISLLATGNHLWSGHIKVRKPSRKMLDGTRVYEGEGCWEERSVTWDTNKISSLPRTKNKNGTPHFARSFQIDLPSPLAFDEAELPIDPYILGAWLGDGYSHSGKICAGKQDRDWLSSFAECTTYPSSPDMVVGTVSGLKESLKALGLLNNKHIPNMFLFGSEKQRLSLVQGLMDTDGHCSKNGTAEFTNTNIQVVDGLCFLLSSLGFKYRRTERVGSLNGKQHKPFGRLNITVREDMSLFSMERKATLQKSSCAATTKRRHINSIEPAGIGMAQCIEVEGGLYLAGKELILTHNCSRDGSTQEIVEKYCASVENAKHSFKNLKWAGIEGIQISFPGDCIEGVVSQGGKNLWLTQESITEQTRILRRLMMYTVETLAPLVDKVFLDVVGGNHDEAQRDLNYYPGNNWATESAIAVGDAMKMNPTAYGHVQVRIPEKWSGMMTVPVGDSIVTIAHGHQWRKNGAMQWWAEQAVNNQPAGSSQILQHGHWHQFQLGSNKHRTVIGSPTFDMGSDWLRNKTGATAKQGALVYLLAGGELSHLSLV